MDFSRESLDREFPSRLATIQMNHAAVSPLPARGAAALAEYARDLSTRGPLAFPELVGADRRPPRERGARLLGVTEELGGASSIAIVPNTTYGLSLVAQGLDWRPGDVVVTTESEFPANLTPWLDLARLGVEVRRVPTRDGAFTAEEVFAACDARTRLVSLSLVAYHTGFVAPAAEVGAFCRDERHRLRPRRDPGRRGDPGRRRRARRRLPLRRRAQVDARPRGVRALLHDALVPRRACAPPSGWLNLKRTNPARTRSASGPSTSTDATKFEIGAPPMPGVYALDASIGLLLEIGSETIGERIRAVLAVLEEGLPRLGLAPVLHGQAVRSGILAARPPAGDGRAPGDEAPRGERRRLLGARRASSGSRRTSGTSRRTPDGSSSSSRGL